MMDVNNLMKIYPQLEAMARAEEIYWTNPDSGC